MNNPLPSGTTLRDGKYLIQALHKIGGQSIVYEGLNVQSGQIVILKQNHEDEEWSHSVIRQEAALLSNLHHRSLPQCLDCFSERGSTFLVITHVPGNDISDILRRRGSSYPYTEVLDWINQLLDILEYLQSQQPAIIHRDINPKNIRLTHDGQIFLLDFGIAKRTNLKTFLSGGTPRYAPPEQLKDEGTDVRSDLYALAATAYFMLTAKQPSDSLSRVSAVLKGLPDPLRPAFELNTDVPPLVSQVLSRVLSVDREHRPPDAVVMKQWLSKAVEGDYFDEEITQVATHQSNHDTTRVTVKNSRKVVIPFDTATRVDVTADANRLITMLNGGYSLAPTLIQVFLEMLDSQPEHRKAILAHYSNHLQRNREDRSDIAINLIRSIASGSYIEPEVRKQLRMKLGRFLADHALSEISAGSKNTDADEKANIIHPDVNSPAHYLAYRAWLRNVMMWLIRGAMGAIAAQLILSLFITVSIETGFLLASSWGGLWLIHILLVCVTFLVVVLTRRMRKNVEQVEKRPTLVGQILGFCFGVLLGLIIFHDFLWVIGFI